MDEEKPGRQKGGKEGKRQKQRWQVEGFENVRQKLFERSNSGLRILINFYL